MLCTSISADLSDECLSEEPENLATYHEHIKGVLSAIKHELEARGSREQKATTNLSGGPRVQDRQAGPTAPDDTPAATARPGNVSGTPTMVASEPEEDVQALRHEKSLAQLLVPLAFGTARSFDVQILVSERKRHETKEATSAITYRYNNAVAMGILDSLRAPQDSSLSPSQSAAPPPAPNRGDSTKLKASLVSQITRVISTERASGTAGVKDDGRAEASGVERKTRWEGAAREGKKGAGEENAVAIVKASGENGRLL